MPHRTKLILLGPLAILTTLLAAWLMTVEAAPADAIEITSDVPWNEVEGEALIPGQVVSYTFSAEAGQVATLDVIVPEGSLLEGQVTVAKASDGLRITDDVYGPATALFRPAYPGGLTAAVPETGDYLIEIDPNDFGDGTTGSFILHFNLLYPAYDLVVSQDPDACRQAGTGFVRAAVRAAKVGGEVYVCPGHYTESQVIHFGTPDIRLYSLHSPRPTIESFDFQTLYLQATDLTISGLDLRGGSSGIVGPSSGFRPDRLHLFDCRLEGAVSAIELAADDATIHDCTIQLQSVGFGNLDAILIDGDRSHVYDNEINTLSGDEHTYSRYGIRLIGDDVHVHDNEIGQPEWPTNTQWAIRVFGDKALVKDNDIAGYTVGIRVQVDPAITSTATVRNNLLYGDNVGASSAGIEIVTVDQAEVSGNFISGTPFLGGGIRLSSSGGRVVNNRVTMRNQNALTYEDSFDLRSPASFVNNTTVFTEAHPFGRGLYIYSSGAPATATLPISVTNNLLVAPLPEQDWDNYCGVSAASRLQLLSNNLVAGFDTAFCATAETGSGGIRLAAGESPGLADGELHLTDSSPAIDAGAAIGAPLVDFEGEGRPQNQGFDIGADEKAVPADLALIITPDAGATCGLVNQDLTYELSVRNLGPALATGVVLTDTVTGSFAAISGVPEQGACSGSGPLTCALGDLVAGEAVTVQIIVTPSAAGLLINEVTVGSAIVDTVLDNNQGLITADIAAVSGNDQDIEPVALSASQAIQNLNNDAPLAAGKQTQVRLHVLAHGRKIRNIRALLAGTHDGVPLPGSPLEPLPQYNCLDIEAKPLDRTDLDASFVFDLPDSWLNGQVTLYAEVNPGDLISETDYDNNAISQTISFQDQPPLCIMTYPVRTDGTGDGPGIVLGLHPLPDYLLADPDQILRRALSELPTHDIRIFPQSTLLQEWNAHEGLGSFEFSPNDEDWTKVQEKLWWHDRFSRDPAECRQADARVLHLGMIHDGTFGIDEIRTAGIGMYNSDPLTVIMNREPVQDFNDPAGGRTLAHEIGHNFNRRHVPSRTTCGSDPNDPWLWRGWEFDPIDRDYPYDTCQIDDGLLSDPATYSGTDLMTTTLNIITPTLAADLMSYGTNRWTSDYTWRHIGYKICAKRYSRSHCEAAWLDGAPDASMPAGQEESTLANASGEVLIMAASLVSDVVEFAGTQRLPAGVVDDAELADIAPASSPSPWSLNLVDDSQQLLASYPISITASSGHDGESLFFGVGVPFITGTAELRLDLLGSAVATQTISPSVPEVTVIAPNGDEVITDSLTVSWQSSDADGDDLVYSIQYSNDQGQSWQALATDLSMTTTVTVDITLLPGSDEQSLVRVLANDGVNTGIDESNAPFSVQPRDPLAMIHTPDQEARYRSGARIELAGLGYDPEDGQLTGDRLTWQLEGYGIVGSGRQATIFGLPAGAYQLTLTATDSDGQTNTASVTINVLPGGQKTASVFLPLLSR